ncbi:ATP-grasp peptide maturase system methyltransferase [Actinomadura roseirufa]|uniref:ATP-grasp peptide maturase system methyltransferase n=1 Tax=Actinomadura roseirufa TaxID=2094049 RepID=UPI001041108A|nr:ATP-grasp peptide maturase system methyltransferase [Actinomadura roseirufa]
MTAHPADLPRQLADHLERAGALRSPAWRAAVESTPRHEFIPEFFQRTDTERGTMWEPVTRTAERGRWLELAYQDQTWVTQLDRHVTPGQVSGPVTGEPTSSSTLPSLVVGMLENLDVGEDANVLEIGTGTGYSTALLAARLGDDQVTSIEYDADVAARAAAALTRAGHSPHLITGDGLDGAPGRAPFDRIIATCSVRHIPAAWLAQARPGARILVTVSGWLHGHGLALLTVNPDGTADGRFLPGTISFMIARSHAAPAIPSSLYDELTAELGDAPARPASVGGDVRRDWTGVFVAQLAAPGAQWQARRTDGGPWIDYYIDPVTRSAAALTPVPGGGWSVRQTGPVRLWDDIERAVGTWHDAGSPHTDQFRIHINGDTQTITLDETAWTLPTQGPALSV